MAKSLKPKQTEARTLSSEEKAAYGKTRRKRYQATQSRIFKNWPVDERELCALKKKRKA